MKWFSISLKNSFWFAISQFFIYFDFQFHEFFFFSGGETLSSLKEIVTVNIASTDRIVGLLSHLKVCIWNIFCEIRFLVKPPPITHYLKKNLVFFENRIMYATLKLPLNNAEMVELIVKSMDYTWLDVKDVKKMNLLPQVHTYLFTFSLAVCL